MLREKFEKFEEETESKLGDIGSDINDMLNTLAKIDKELVKNKDLLRGILIKDELNVEVPNTVMMICPDAKVVKSFLIFNDRLVLNLKDNETRIIRWEKVKHAKASILEGKFIYLELSLKGFIRSKRLKYLIYTGDIKGFMEVLKTLTVLI